MSKYDHILKELQQLPIVVYYDDIVTLSPEAKHAVYEAAMELPKEKTYSDWVAYCIRWMSIVHSKLN